MRLVRFGEPGSEKPGILDADQNIRDASAVVDDWNGAAITSERLAQIRAVDLSTLPVVHDNPRLGPPIANVRTFIGIGLNYSDHALESGMDIPTEPIVFLKAPGSICGPMDAIEKPLDSMKLDWEVELAIVIGKTAKYVDEATAMHYVAGYTICNDVSERYFQLERLGQWTKGKSHDTFGPLGPYLVTEDEVADVSNLSMWLDVNGERRQTGSTSKMIFKVPELVAYLSRIMTLQPGDVITTGTPPGVGMGMTPPVYLEVGDVVTLGIEGLGQQRQEVKKASHND